MHIENSQTEAMARELTVVEKGPPHPNSASARAHELEIEPTSFSSTVASSSARMCQRGATPRRTAHQKESATACMRRFIGASPFIALISD
ncbi:hypothetical protein [Bradyrhizobium sp. 197]|uniref:hypothetical protein n=1 Tax=Bradyrhizobium sp. 197 TaxID=2782663 RepID=UPI001FFB6EF9|nr:hypothetical protein [Bradyrhizobium sp. 197]